MVFESLGLLSEMASGSIQLLSETNATQHEELTNFVASVDGDVVQAMTAVEKALVVPTGTRKLMPEERTPIQNLYDVLSDSNKLLQNSSDDSLYDRGLSAAAGVLGITQTEPISKNLEVQMHVPAPPSAQETFQLGNKELPRIFSGLWQMSSPAWGAAPTSKVIEQFNRHVQSGFTAFDMADHYGDAELIFGRFRAQYSHKQAIFAATKLCVFHKLDNVSQEAMSANIDERCRRLQQQKIDLLQFHWQDYGDPAYIDALRYIAADGRVETLGLCNFDTEHMQKVLDAGIAIHSNQVQFSLIDSRPLQRMAAVCVANNIKLLTYGTLCGGFLSDKWLDQPEPDLYGPAGGITPSQRKYYGMICNWGGWALLQDLLRALRNIATKHNVLGISNVATRWVLDQPCVGAVIIGARMGVSDHSDANTASFGWRLDQQDRDEIEVVLERSRRKEVFERMGDCGAEYRAKT